MANKNVKGPTRASGALSVGLAVFGIIWAFTIYKMKGFGPEPAFGVVFVFLCLGHAVYNFRAVSRQEAIDRGEIPDPRKEAEKAAMEKEAAKIRKKTRRGPVYRVKSKPKRAVNRRDSRRNGTKQNSAKQDSQKQNSQKQGSAKKKSVKTGEGREDQTV